ncbi:hypothetical protein DYB32_007704, partial [Aphanomyces invadans]
MFHVRLEQAAAAYNDEDKPTIEFEVGNPRVELLTGRLRLFRSLETTNDESKDESDDAAGSLSWLPISRDTILSMDLTLLGFVSLPMHMGPLELIEFSKAFRSDIVLIRFLRDADPRPSSRMALMQFSTANKAAQFYEAFNGSLFNSMEPERCRLVFVHKIEFIREQLVQSPPLAVNGHPVAQGMLPSFATDDRRDAPEGHVEIPTCPVCLDRLDSSASGILTTLCNHTFHCDCLFRWEGFNCPVCRYSHGDIVSACEVCNTTDHLWICLLCGHIGCGRYSNEHAKKHYQETLHTYSLELETQRVWDYAGDGYRLFGWVSVSKGTQPQLEEQRLFYERRLSQLNETEHRRAVSMLEQEKKALKKLNENLIKETTKLNEDLHFARFEPPTRRRLIKVLHRELNKSLIDNQLQWKERVLAAEEKVATMETDTQRRVDDLESQVGQTCVLPAVFCRSPRSSTRFATSCFTSTRKVALRTVFTSERF